MEKESFLTREKLLGHQQLIKFPLKFIVFLLIVLTLLDLIFLNYKILTQPYKEPQQSSVGAATRGPSSSESSSLTEALDVCPQSCISQINALSSSGIKEKETVAPAESFAREFFIPLGSSVNFSDDWQDVAGLQAYVDGSAYGRIKKITFEASVRVPTGNQTANVRLFNVTAKHPVWFSEVLFTGGGSPQFLVSEPIALDSGNSLYKVQMKTQLKYAAYLDQARIHIISN